MKILARDNVRQLRYDLTELSCNQREGYILDYLYGQETMLNCVEFGGLYPDESSDDPVFINMPVLLDIYEDRIQKLTGRSSLKLDPDKFFDKIFFEQLTPDETEALAAYTIMKNVVDSNSEFPLTYDNHRLEILDMNELSSHISSFDANSPDEYTQGELDIFNKALSGGYNQPGSSSFDRGVAVDEMNKLITSDDYDSNLFAQGQMEALDQITGFGGQFMVPDPTYREPGRFEPRYNKAEHYQFHVTNTADRYLIKSRLDEANKMLSGEIPIPSDVQFHEKQDELGLSYEQFLKGQVIGYEKITDDILDKFWYAHGGSEVTDHRDTIRKTIEFYESQDVTDPDELARNMGTVSVLEDLFDGDLLVTPTRQYNLEVINKYIDDRCNVDITDYERGQARMLDYIKNTCRVSGEHGSYGVPENAIKALATPEGITNIITVNGPIDDPSVFDARYQGAENMLQAIIDDTVPQYFTPVPNRQILDVILQHGRDSAIIECMANYTPMGDLVTESGSIVTKSDMEDLGTALDNLSTETGLEL